MYVNMNVSIQHLFSIVLATVGIDLMMSIFVQVKIIAIITNYKFCQNQILMNVMKTYQVVIKFASTLLVATTAVVRKAMN